MYAKTHGIIFISMLTLAILSPKTDISVYSKEVWTKEIKTTSGSMESRVDEKVQTGTKEDKREKWVGNISRKNDELRKLNGTIERIPCESTCKIQTLKDIGIRPEIAESLVNNCKKQNIEVVNCIKLWASIVVAESWWWKRCNKNWCFGILAKVQYSTVEEWVEDWVNRFWKYWLNQKNPSSFYSNSPNWNPKTRYCMSERQQDGSKLSYCKNWYKHAWDIFNKLDKKF